MTTFLKFNRTPAYREYVRDWERRLTLAERLNDCDSADYAPQNLKAKPPRRIVK